MTISDHVIAASKEAISQLSESGGRFELLGGEQKTLILVYSAQGVIDNGGLPYFFESPWPDQLDYSAFVDAYRTIGAVDASKAFGEAVAMFTIQNPDLDEALRIQTIDRLSSHPRFLELDTFLCGNQTVWSQLESYVLSIFQVP